MSTDEKAFDPSKITFPEHIMTKLRDAAAMSIRTPEGQVIFYVLDALKSYPLKLGTAESPAKAERDKKVETNGAVGANL